MPLKGRKQSPEHVEHVRQALLKYYSKHKAKPSDKKGLKAWDRFDMAKASFRQRGLDEKVSVNLANKMFRLRTRMKRKAFFEATKNPASCLYTGESGTNSPGRVQRVSCGKRHLSLEQKAKLRAANLGKTFNHSIETRERMREIAIENLESGRTKPSANSVKGRFYSKKNDTWFRYRSGWERQFMVRLEDADNVISYEFEPFSIRYVFAGKEHIYFPDFKVKTKREDALVEVKPKRFLKDNQVIAKIRAGRKFCSKKGIPFVIVTEDHPFWEDCSTFGRC